MASTTSSNQDTESISEESKSNEDRVPFIEDVTLALNAAKSQNKILIVCCEEAESITNALWENPKVIDAFAKHGVGLLIRENTLPFHQFTVLYPVIAFPCLYCINPQNGQVLQCKYSQDVTVDIAVKSITASSELMQQQQQQQQSAMNAVTHSNTNINDENIRNAEEAPKPKSALSKLEQIRQKAKAQKQRKATESTNNSKSASPKQPTPTVPKLNNYNFEQEEEKLDAIRFMEITRKDKLRKRKNKKNSKLKLSSVSAASTSSQRMNSTKEDDVYASTPILSVSRSLSPADSPLRVTEKKRVRMAFRINNEMDLQHHFNYDDKLLDVMLFVQNETGMNDFIFISQYPPLHIDSVYLDGKMSQQIGLFANNNADDEKSNESKYDDVQKKLHQTLYELNLVPSCRVFIQPKFKGTPRRNDEGDNALMKVLYFLLDILKLGLEFGWKGIVYALSIIWMIIEIPLNMLGITSSNSGGNRRGDNKNSNRPNSKLKAMKKDKRLAGKKSNIRRLRHDENEDDENRLNNGNSTMYGGDGD